MACGSLFSGGRAQRDVRVPQEAVGRLRRDGVKKSGQKYIPTIFAGYNFTVHILLKLLTAALSVDIYIPGVISKENGKASV